MMTSLPPSPKCGTLVLKQLKILTLSSAMMMALLFVALPAYAEAPCTELAKEQPDRYKKWLELQNQASQNNKDQKFKEAGDHLIDAVKICANDPLLEMNVARVYHKANNCSLAELWYDKILARKKSDQSSDPQIQKIISLAETYRLELNRTCITAGTLNVQCNEADVYLNIGENISQPCPFLGDLEAGTYTLTARKEGHEPYSAQIELKATELQKHTVPKLVKGIVEATEDVPHHWVVGGAIGAVLPSSMSIPFYDDTESLRSSNREIQGGTAGGETALATGFASELFVDFIPLTWISVGLSSNLSFSQQEHTWSALGTQEQLYKADDLALTQIQAMAEELGLTRDEMRDLLGQPLSVIKLLDENGNPALTQEQINTLRSNGFFEKVTNTLDRTPSTVSSSMLSWMLNLTVKARFDVTSWMDVRAVFAIGYSMLTADLFSGEFLEVEDLSNSNIIHGFNVSGGVEFVFPITEDISLLSKITALKTFGAEGGNISVSPSPLVFMTLGLEYGL